MAESGCLRLMNHGRWKQKHNGKHCQRQGYHRQSSVSQNLDKRTLHTETCKGKRNLQCGSVLRWTSVLGHSHTEKSNGKFVDTRQVSPIFTLLFMTKNMVQMSPTIKINFTHLDIENPLGTLDLFSNFLIRPSSTSAF